jgi:cytochrome c5
MGIVVLLVGLVLLGLTVWFLVNSLLNTIQRNSTRGLDSEETVQMQQALVKERMQKIGFVKAGYVPKVPPKRTGKEIVADVCGECHVEGSMGAPVIGSKDWAERFANGFDSLLETAQKGKGDMPPRGDDPSLTDKDLMRAIAYMLKESGLTPPVIDPPKKDGKGAEGDKPAEKGAAPAAGAEGAAPAEAAPAPVTPEQTSSAAGTLRSGLAERMAEHEFNPFDLDSVPAERKGEAVFAVVCKGCHQFMPPRAGSKEDWAHVAAKGMDQLYNSTLFGTFGMPPKGGRLDLSDEDIKASVDYMASLAR